MGIPLSPVPGTFFEWEDQSDIVTPEITSVSEKPLFCAVISADKGKENWQVLSGQDWFDMYAVNSLVDFNKHGQPLLQTAMAVNAGAEILNIENVASLSLVADMKTRVGDMLSSLDYIVLIVLVCAGALAFIVLYNLTNITITERTREIATLKVLGFHRGEQNAYVFRENIILTIISAICGIPFGIALLQYTMSQIKIDGMYFGCRLNITSCILSLVITLFFTVAVDIALLYGMSVLITLFILVLC